MFVSFGDMERFVVLTGAVETVDNPCLCRSTRVFVSRLPVYDGRDEQPGLGASSGRASLGPQLSTARARMNDTKPHARPQPPGPRSSPIPVAESGAGPDVGAPEGV